MTLVRRPSPVGDILTLRQAMDRLFEDSFFRTPFVTTTWASDTGLPLDISSNPDALVVEAALPGIKPDDVDITIEGNTLTISGSYKTERDGEQTGDYLVRELRRGAFSRTVALPEGLEADKAEATFEHGVLTLTVPKAEQTKPRQIRISPTSGDAARVVSGDGQA